MIRREPKNPPVPITGPARNDLATSCRNASVDARHESFQSRSPVRLDRPYQLFRFERLDRINLFDRSRRLDFVSTKLSHASFTFLFSIVVAIFLLAHPAAAVVETVITAIKFEGLNTIEEEQVRSKIKSRVGRVLDEKTVDSDIKTLDGTNWFSHVKSSIQPDPNGKGSILVFEVIENPLLKSVEIRGITRHGIKLKEIENNTGLKKGARFDYVRNINAVQQIKQLYIEKGFELVDVKLLKGGKPGDNEVIISVFEGPRFQIKRVQFEGNKFSPDGVLMTKITNRRKLLGLLPGTYHSDMLEEDIRKLVEYYEANGYLMVDVSAITRRMPGDDMGDLTLVFVIDEGIQYKINEIQFAGNKRIPTSKLREAIKLKPGMAYKEDMKEIDQKSIQIEYNEIGCIKTQITAQRGYPNKRGMVDLIWRIEESEPFLTGEIKIQGNTNTQDRVIRREANMAGLVPGEPLNMNRVDLLRQRLGNLGYFQSNPQQGKPIDIHPANERPADKPYGDVAPTLSSATPAPPAPGSPVTRYQDPGDPPAMGNDPADDLLSGGAANPAGAAANGAGAGAGQGQGQGAAGGINAGDNAGGSPLPPAIGGGIEPPALGPGSAFPFGVGEDRDEIDRFAPPINSIPEEPTPLVPGPQPGTLTPQPPPSPNRTKPVGSGVPPGVFPSLPGSSMTNLGPDRQEPYNNRSIADVIVSVDEAPTGRFNFGVGVSSFMGLLGYINLVEQNFDLFNVPRSWDDVVSGNAFRGAGQQLSINMTVGNFLNMAQVSLLDPYLFDLPIGGSVTGSAFTRIYPDWLENRVGGKLGLGRQFGTSIYADVTMSAEDIDFYGFRTPAPANYLAAEGHTFLATLSPSIRYDNRNHPFSPTSGQYIEARFLQAWGSFTFPQATIEGRKYWTLGSRPDGSGKRVLLVRGVFGATGQDTPVYEKFFAGDFRSFRGFWYRGVGPHIFGANTGGFMEALGTLEYQFPLMANDRLHQVIFTDFGTITQGYSLNAFRIAVGTGLRISLPGVFPMPIALDLAVPLMRQPGDQVRYFMFNVGASY